MEIQTIAKESMGQLWVVVVVADIAAMADQPQLQKDNAATRYKDNMQWEDAVPEAALIADAHCSESSSSRVLHLLRPNIGKYSNLTNLDELFDFF